MTTFALSPFRNVDALHDEVDRFLRAGTSAAASAWTPAMDVAESDDAWLITVELPGLSREDVQVSLEDGALVIAGERQRAEADGVQWRRLERRVGGFQRTIRLPERVDLGKIEASMSDGVLAISLAKAEEAKPRTITIT